jgi:hypothetical protein
MSIESVSLIWPSIAAIRAFAPQVKIVRLQLFTLRTLRRIEQERQRPKRLSWRPVHDANGRLAAHLTQGPPMLSVPRLFS